MQTESVWQHFRQQIVENMHFEVDPNYYVLDTLQLGPRLRELAKSDHHAFISLCQKLLQDETKVVRQGTLMLLSCGISRDFALAQIIIECNVDDEELREHALGALSHVATHAAFSILYHYALHGSTSALYGIGNLAREPEEKQAVVAVARKYITAPDFPLRTAALTLLGRYSRVEWDVEFILQAVSLYKDENFIGILEKAPATKVLPTLKTLLAEVPVHSTMFDDLSQTIQFLEQK